MTEVIVVSTTFFLFVGISALHQVSLWRATAGFHDLLNGANPEHLLVIWIARHGFRHTINAEMQLYGTDDYRIELNAFRIIIFRCQTPAC